ncbi:unnamed protein product [Blepharisma stoltei]|uniref:Uncharacterized protein n=1 Tax=Blepharisma stoltei TaxID=1481888 RepID=A0AAU9JB38_9CILI|nr:unnamed protein product [Blepharisma stoltei]
MKVLIFKNLILAYLIDQMQVESDLNSFLHWKINFLFNSYKNMGFSHGWRYFGLDFPTGKIFWFYQSIWYRPNQKIFQVGKSRPKQRHPQ